MPEKQSLSNESCVCTLISSSCQTWPGLGRNGLAGMQEVSWTRCQISFKAKRATQTPGGWGQGGARGVGGVGLGECGQWGQPQRWPSPWPTRTRLTYFITLKPPGPLHLKATTHMAHGSEFWSFWETTSQDLTWVINKHCFTVEKKCMIWALHEKCPTSATLPLLP